MAAPTPKERAYRIHNSRVNGVLVIDDLIDYITNEEEDNEHKPDQLEYWYEVRDEYIKIKTDESLGRTKE